MALEIYNGSTLLYSLPRVLGASLVDKLSGERTLSFSSLISRSQEMRPGLTAKLDGQYYNIVRVSRKITGGFPVTTAECEHISYPVSYTHLGSPAEERLMKGGGGDGRTSLEGQAKSDSGAFRG